MNNKRLKEIIKQVLYNPQVSYPPVSYKITDVDNTFKGNSYTSKYIDVGDFKTFLKRLEKQLIYRLTSK